MEPDALVPSALAFVRRCRCTWTRGRRMLAQSVRRTKTMANRHRSSPPTYVCGQRVWLSTKDLPLQAPSRKLAPKVKPFSSSRLNPANTIPHPLPLWTGPRPTWSGSCLTYVAAAEDSSTWWTERAMVQRRGVGCRLAMFWTGDEVSPLPSCPVAPLGELDLSGNNPGESGVNMLIDLLKKPDCKLKTLRYLKSPAAEEACKYLTEVLGENPLLLKELDLSRNELGGLDVEKLSALLIDSHTRLEKIRLNNCDLTEKNCSALAAVLSSNTILKEMDLSNNRLLDSGVKQLCNELKKSKLQILKLPNCSITEEGYKSLASALESNPSHLTELDLTGNDPGESGVKNLIDVLQRSLSVCDERQQNPLLLKELNLSTKKLDDTKVKQLAALLEDKHCKLKTLLLSDCGLTERSCSTLATVLSNTSLKELDISNNNLLDSGVEKLQIGLKNTNCKLEKLRMSTCSITEAGYNSLALALELNPSHLTELDLTGNDPGESGVKKLIDVPKKSNCTLRFLEGPAEEACRYFKKVLNENPLLMRELNLSKKKVGNTSVNRLAALLRDKHCKLKKIQLCGCSITVKQCEILTAALRSNPSYLRELSLSNNKIKNGGKHIGDLLKDPNCKLENLELRNCSLIDEDYSSLISSSLKRLYLSGNELGDAGVKNLCVLLRSSQTKLETLELCGCSITGKQCADLSAALRSNLSYLRELNLSGNAIKDGVRDLFELLNYSDCKLEKLELCNCSITNKHCEILVLSSKHSSLRELNLSENELKNKGLGYLCDILNNSHCKLEKLSLNDCKIKDVGLLATSKAMSVLKELDLSNNNIEVSSKKQLTEVFERSSCNLRLDSGNWLKKLFTKSEHEKSEKSLEEDKRVDDESWGNLCISEV
nr:uncharacterized protein LOC129447483 [Misgurnus anguillicaudatus]